MFIATSLSYYKRPEIREAIVREAMEREVSVKFDNTYFGKRPDVLNYENDVLEFAKKKASSFHCSEERWFNPLNIQTGMKRHELDELRSGWDLILDVDCPDWEFSKLITHLFIKALQDHGVQTIGVKFSGNKGFHIAVPFEAFPQTVETAEGTLEVKNLFPEGPRRIATYLLDYIKREYATIKENQVTFLDSHQFSLDTLQTIAQKSSQSLFHFRCVNCKSEFASNPLRERKYFPCKACGYINPFKNQTEDIITCANCGRLAKLVIESSGCPSCKSKEGMEQFVNLLSVVEVDTVLIASRHLFRMPYSLHEKSGLASIPIDPDQVLSFNKEDAQPEKVTGEQEFIKRNQSKANEAHDLFVAALHADVQSHIHGDVDKKQLLSKKIEIPTTAIPEDFFPPCMKLISQGLEDGKKRALFTLINFLRVSGWDKDAIEEYIYAWNERNPEPLREQYLKSQLSQIGKGKAPLPPPNCSNRDYYKSLLVCQPDEFCPKIRNPAMYAKRKFELSQRQTKRTKKKKAKKASKTKKKPQESSSKKTETK